MANQIYNKLESEIVNSIEGLSPLIYLSTAEEERSLKAINNIAANFAKKVFLWMSSTGFKGLAEDTKNPVTAVKVAISSNENAFYVFSDLSDFFHIPELISALKEFAFSQNAGLNKTIIIISSEFKIPATLEKIISIITAPPPDRSEIKTKLQEIQKSYPNNPINPDFEDDIVNALAGLSMPEIESVIHRLLRVEKKDKDTFFRFLFAEKQSMMKKSGFLEFTPPSENIDSMGGLDNLKQWLIKRQKIFSKEALDANIPIPKGLLMMGVSGCGKSMAVKTIPSLWKIPLYRMDMNLIFSGIYGSPEATFHKALRSLEIVAPAVLWIDEIENALGMEESGLQISSHIFSSFLTWMQEKPPFIFIAATANRIQALPAEVIRKGRFDQIFFVDLPTENERKQIFSIYLKKHGADISQFDLKMLSILTKGWNGAEIAQVVAEAKTDAFYENRSFTQADITANINKTVPLSTTMEAQIKAIRSWAVSRATPASAEGKILHY